MSEYVDVSGSMGSTACVYRDGTGSNGITSFTGSLFVLRIYCNKKLCTWFTYINILEYVGAMNKK